ncbi:hypothetical protein MMC06_006685 [Schaereria dolodes]|nr:hypothetical protein [Schaereria dolodes]
MTQSSGELIALSVMFSLVAVVFIAFRWWARYLKDLELKADDYFIFVATLLFVTLQAIPTIVLCVKTKFGDPLPTGPESQFIPPPTTYTLEVCQLILEATAYVPIGITKLSILFFYRRIFRGTAFNIVTWTTIGLVASWIVAFFFATIFGWTPVQLSLHDPNNPDVHCIDSISFFYGGAGSDVLIDFIILAMPAPFLWRLHMCTSRKIGVMCMFLLGTLTIAASIARLVAFVQAASPENAEDSDYQYFLATLPWTFVESVLAIISACLPTLHPLFRDWCYKSMIRSLRSRLSSQSIDSRDPQCNETVAAKQQIRYLGNMSDLGHGTTIIGNGATINELPKLSAGRVLEQKDWLNFDNMV